jgi:hypothetical protein
MWRARHFRGIVHLLCLCVPPACAVGCLAFKSCFPPILHRQFLRGSKRKAPQSVTRLPLLTCSLRAQVRHPDRRLIKRGRHEVAAPEQLHHSPPCAAAALQGLPRRALRRRRQRRRASAARPSHSPGSPRRRWRRRKRGDVEPGGAAGGGRRGGGSSGDVGGGDFLGGEWRIVLIKRSVGPVRAVGPADDSSARTGAVKGAPARGSGS